MGYKVYVSKDVLTKEIAGAKKEANLYADEKLTEGRNYIDNQIDIIKNDIGDLSKLETTNKSNLVDAINEARGTGSSSSVDDEALNAEIERAKAAEAKALEDAKAYTDEKIAAEVTARDAAISNTKEEVKAYTDNAVAQKTKVQLIIWGADD